VNNPAASLYIWARVPSGYTSAEFAARLIDEIGVVVTPGPAFGPSGEGFVRLSITTPDERVEEGARRLLEWAAKNR
jgi:LL-diaminopimelate aminotransferase